MKPYTGKIEAGVRVRVRWYNRPVGCTQEAINEIEDFFADSGIPMIKFKGSDIKHEMRNILFYEI